MTEYPIEIERIEQRSLKQFLKTLKSNSKQYLLRNELLIHYKHYHEENDLEGEAAHNYVYRFLRNVQEMIVLKKAFICVYRFRIAKYIYYRIKLNNKVEFIPIPIEDYLDARDFVITGRENSGKGLINIDFLPFYDYSPKIHDSTEIGHGIQFLNRYLSSSIFQNPRQWHETIFNYLRIHNMQGHQLMIKKDNIKSYQDLKKKLDFIVEEYKERSSYFKLSDLEQELDNLGFERGWGNTPERILETMQLLREFMDAPEDEVLEHFISRIPMVSKIAIISPHGWFGQQNVLGRPDTGGQVVYILDKVKYLEKQLKKSNHLAGVNIVPKIVILTRLIPEADGTTCNQALEKVKGTENTWICRVPFKQKDGSIHPHWVSRFHIWPYLEQFALDSKERLMKEFQGRPDLIVGNYSDGNLVATFLSQQLGVMQCNIAHALEKSKYIFSDLYWESMEERYNFSFQYTADLISMNMASFIITSTFQEIGGTQDAQGQYESYITYSMPNLYHVKNGVSLFHPKFNVVPPGVPENIFYAYGNNSKRSKTRIQKMNEQVFRHKGPHIIGELSDENKFPIFSMARIDKVKNLSGLIELFGRHSKLREIANLILITDKTTLEQSKDEEEQHEIKKIYELIEKYNLKSNMRWVGIGASGSRDELAEVYRIIGDRRGIFVQPALFEAFGLTVLEAMASGLPTFATQFGGPSEIIVEGESGFLINPTTLDDTAEKIYQFFIQAQQDSKYWEKISQQALNRIKKCYNWNLYTERLLTLTKLHGFWKYAVSMKAKQKMRLYCDLIFDDFYRKRLPEDY